MRTICLTLIFQCFVSFTVAQSFEIVRQSNGRDSFNIPASMCNQNGTNSGGGCRTFYAVDRVRKCSCSCPARNATFAFHNKRWSCLENRPARSHFYRGCGLTASFSRESRDRRLPSIAVGDWREISVDLVFGLWQLWRCSVNIRSSWYMGCWGSRHRLSQYYNTVVRLFTISKRSSSAPYFLEVNRNVPGTNLFRGKIINLIVECRMSFMGQHLDTKNCLLFKLEGKTICPVTKPTVSASSTMQPLKPSFTFLSTPRITSSRVSTNTTTIQQSSSNTMTSVTSYRSLTTPFTIFATTSTISIYNTTASEVSTYLKTQSISSEILPTIITSQSTVSEVSRTLPASQSSVFGVSPTTLANQSTISETSPKAQTIQPTMSELLPTASVSQPTDLGISPTPLVTQHIVSESSLKARTLQVTNSEILPEASIFHSNVSAMSPTPSLLLSVSSEVSPEEPETQPTISEMSPAALDSRERSLTEPDHEGPHAQLTISISPSSAPTTQPTVSETLPTEPPTDPETARTLAEQYPKIINTEPSTSLSNAPPSISHDREESRGKDSSSLGLIAGIASAVVLTAAIAVFIAYRRHYTNERRPRSNSIGTVSEATMETIVMSPQTRRTHKPNTEGKNNKEQSLSASADGMPAWLAEVPHSHVNSSLDDDDNTSHLYAPLNIPQLEPDESREPVYQVLEKPELAQEPPVGQVLEKDRRGANIHCNKSEPFYYVLEGPHLEDSETSGQCGAIPSEEPVYSTLDEVYPDLSGASDCGPKCKNDPVYNVLERRYFEGSKVPDHYVFVSPNGQIFNRLERPCTDTSTGPTNNDPTCADLPIRNVLEERYFEGSEIADHYVQISPNGTLDNIIRRLNSNSSKVSSLGRSCANEPLEERYFESSEVPDHYVYVSPKGKVFSKLEELSSNPNSLKRPNCEPECLDEPGYSTWKEHYLEDSEDTDQYVAMMSPGEQVYSTEEVDRNTYKPANYDERYGTNRDQTVNFRRSALTRIPRKQIARKQSELSTEKVTESLQ